MPIPEAFLSVPRFFLRHAIHQSWVFQTRQKRLNCRLEQSRKLRPKIGFLAKNSSLSKVPSTNGLLQSIEILWAITSHQYMLVRKISAFYHFLVWRYEVPKLIEIVSSSFNPKVHRIPRTESIGLKIFCAQLIGICIYRKFQLNRLSTFWDVRESKIAFR